MKRIEQSRSFIKSSKKCGRRGLDMSKLLNVIGLLAGDMDLPERCRPHKLSGNYADNWECHIEPDWLLIYKYDEEALYLIETGTHSDLFR